ncbi:hypothetical protein MPSEU_000980200 [Mayamaea pseudoterrestris]|nr:hypothetical protein MPSEU_000980200 [Mayamaea pseudoterrestris]
MIASNEKSRRFRSSITVGPNWWSTTRVGTFQRKLLWLVVGFILLVLLFRRMRQGAGFQYDFDNEEDDGNPIFPEKIELRMVSMNIARCRPSASAPHSWTADDQMQALRSELLASDPHIILLQEGPHATFNPFNESFILMGSRPSHKGFILHLVRQDLASHASIVNLPDHIPAVLATLQIPGTGSSNIPVLTLDIAAVHLNPSSRLIGKRRDQLEQLLIAATKHAALATTPSSLLAPRLLLLGGDTNLRESTAVNQEEQRLLQASGWQDVWVQYAAANDGDVVNTQFTWDTVNHLDETLDGATHQGQKDYWNNYHGNETTQMLQRYDRFYYHEYDSPKRHPRPLSVKVKSFGLVAHRPRAGTKTLFLSDHFGIRTTLEFDLS